MSSTPERQAAEAQIEARDDDLRDMPTLLDWRRRVATLYSEVRAEPDPQPAQPSHRAARPLD